MIKITKKTEKIPVYDITVEKNHNFFANDVVVHNCTEIIEYSSPEETAVCNLASIALPKFVVGKGKKAYFDFDALKDIAYTATINLNRVIDVNYYPTKETKKSNMLHRPIGLGVQGLADTFAMLKIPFDSQIAKNLDREIFETIYYGAMEASVDLAEKEGAYESFKGSPLSEGKFQFDLWGVKPSNEERWNNLKAKIKKTGLRNSLIIAIAPTATIASIVGSYEAIEPQISNLFKRETLSGEFMQVNKYLVNDLKALGLWNEELRNEIKISEGSIQNIDQIPQNLKDLYKTVWEVPMKALVDMAADRGAYIDQAQSLNLFIESPTIGKLSSMYMYAWKRGIKTTYYLRSRPATSIAKTTVKSSEAKTTSSGPSNIMDATTAATAPEKKNYSDSEIIACSLDNPEACEACQ